MYKEHSEPGKCYKESLVNVTEQSLGSVTKKSLVNVAIRIELVQFHKKTLVIVTLRIELGQFHKKTLVNVTKETGKCHNYNRAWAMSQND